MDRRSSETAAAGSVGLVTPTMMMMHVMVLTLYLAMHREIKRRDLSVKIYLKL
jgi:hypothetical protein